VFNIGDLNAKDKLIQARIEFQKENPFFSFLAMNLEFRKDDKIDTCGVDAYGNFYFNPKFVEKLTSKEVKGVVCHEVMHCALEHMSRRHGRRKQLWNIACDTIVNNIILKEGYSLPDGTIQPYNNEISLFGIKLKKLNEKSSEEVYDELLSGLRKKYGKDLEKFLKENGIKGFDVHIEGGNGNSKGKNKFKKGKNKDWKKILIDAASYAQQRGTLPAGLRRLVDKILETHVDWKTLLYKYITSQLPIDYMWTKPSKKSFATGVYTPGILREGMDLIVAIDTSGSISQYELNEFMSEVLSIIRSFRGVNLTIIDCDAQVNSVKTYRNATPDKIDMELHGGGGTSHVPVYKWINENMPNATLLINFTDGYTEFPKLEDVNVKTLWVLGGYWRVKKEEIPFGDVIELPLEKR